MYDRKCMECVCLEVSVIQKVILKVIRATGRNKNNKIFDIELSG